MGKDGLAALQAPIADNRVDRMSAANHGISALLERSPAGAEQHKMREGQA